MGFVGRRRDRPSESQVSPRAVWYDRNPRTVYNFWGSGGSFPHAYTVRWNYTCASGKKAFVSSCYTEILRVTAPTAVGVSWCWVSVVKELQERLICGVMMCAANVGERASETIGHSVIVLAGEAIRGTTTDGATGGTQGYNVSMSAIEFDV